MKLFTRLCLGILLTLLSFQFSHAQLSGWTYNRGYTGHESAGIGRSDFQLRLQVNTQALINAGQMSATGDDIRFGDACGTMVYDHWVEKNLNTDSTIIWVKVDTIAPNDSATVYLYYGNPVATNSSSFSATFPTGIISAGNFVLSGNQNLGYLKVNAGDTLFVGQGSVLDIQARYVEVNGVIWGKGRGHASPGASQVGQGPGGGGTSTNSGSGGGSYGGIGGLGGYDSGDTPGNGGPVYGTPNQIADIAMGSSGGSASTSLGGAGGGAISVNAEWVLLTGIVNMDGNGGQLPGGGQCGGGGAGGGIRVIADHLWVGGVVRANGGDGSPGTSTANDSGGGGGGGRIKAYHGSTFNISTVPAAQGGLGGPYGTAAPGAPGAVGSIFDTTWVYNPVTVTEGASQSFGYSVSGNPGSPICQGTPVTYTVNSMVGNYTFSVNGVVAQSGLDSTFTTVLPVGIDTVTVTIGNACNSEEVYVVEVLPSPTAVIDRLLIDPCEGDTFELRNTFPSASALWSTGSTADSIFVTTSGTYTLTITDLNGCSDTDTSVINFTPLPMPVITISGDTLTCNSGFVSYQWNLNGTAIPGATSQSYVATTSGIYSVTVGANFCSNTSDTTFVLVGIRQALPTSFTLAPNPTNDRVHLSIGAGIQGDGMIRVMDVTGRELASQPWSLFGNAATTQISLNDFQAGTYLILVEFPQGTFTKWVAKQ